MIALNAPDGLAQLLAADHDPLEASFVQERAGVLRQGRHIPLPVASSVDHAPMAGELQSGADVIRFVQAGNATLTIRSRATGARFTFKFSRPDTEPGRQRPIWVKLLSGPDNESAYTFLGTIWVGSPVWNYRHSAKSPVGEDAPSVKAVRWLVKLFSAAPERITQQAEVWHEGRCGRCGRKLTVPESIASGFGPECIGKL